MALFLARIFWPALLIGLAISIVWRFVSPGWLRTKLQITASLLVFVPQLIIIFFLYQSISLLLYQEALLSLWIIGSAALLASKVWAWCNGQAESPSARQWRNWRKNKSEIALEIKVCKTSRTRENHGAALRSAVAAVVLGGFGFYLARTFVLDAFHSKVIVAGRVNGLRFNRGRGPRLSDIFIDGQMFHATRDLHRQIQSGDYIRAEIGAGSHTILRWERYAPGTTAKEPE
jgi:hypothetical protein